MTAKAASEKGVRPLFSKLGDALESGTVIGLEIRPGGANHLASRHKDYIYGFQWRMGSKQLSHQALRSIAGDGVAHLGTGGDSETGALQPIREGETGHETAPQTDAALAYPCKLRPPGQLVRI